ncbi:hypothetical protein BAE44_0014992 [Dichanthelium oligosanthes]|uniref:B box-type domain-containing protein n=1 Tax=Dichanthelium oligosanthes TaxID=888268 RepID=A0A1E5VFU6_9POAL|nr:hypothetical protein BAE44_0014992 [Dichanthelium oligosanthes]
MRAICDVCESAPAVLFCAADEAALCRPCDEKVHMCNKLASRHVRVGLANSNKLARCDICESFPGDKLGHMDDDIAMQSKDPENQTDQKNPPHSVTKEQMANHHNVFDGPASDGNCEDQVFSLVTIVLGDSQIQTQGMDLSVNNHDSPGVVPTSNYEGDASK